MSDEEYDVLEIVLIGGWHGKTSILNRYAGDTFDEQSMATIGTDFKIKTVVVSTSSFQGIVKAQIWDTAGAERFTSITKAYFRNAHAFVLFYDVTDKDSFDNLNDRIRANGLREYEDVPILLLGNKIDITKKHPEKREVSTQEGIDFAKKHNMTFFETSAKDGTNVNEAMEHIIEVAAPTGMPKEDTEIIFQPAKQSGLFSFLWGGQKSRKSETNQQKIQKEKKTANQSDKIPFSALKKKLQEAEKAIETIREKNVNLRKDRDKFITKSRQNEELRKQQQKEFETKIARIEEESESEKGRLKGQLSKLESQVDDEKTKLFLSEKRSEFQEQRYYSEFEKERKRFESCTRFSDFEILKRLGFSKSKNGFYGVNCCAYLCSLRKSNRIYVMKIVYNYGLDTENIRLELLDKEVPNIPYHQNVATVLKWFIDTVEFETLPDFTAEKALLQEKTAIFIMKFFPTNLHNLIREGQFSPKMCSELKFLYCCKDLLEGLCHLQKNKIVHRDLKPDNIFVDENFRLYIADFGCFLDCKDDGFRFKMPRTVARHFNRGGASEYLAPEILKYEGRADEFLDFSKNDVFSCGLVLYQMITGGKSAFRTLRKGEKFRSQKAYLELKKRDCKSGEIRELIKNMCLVDEKKRIDCHHALEICTKLIERNLMLQKKKQE